MNKNKQVVQLSVVTALSVLISLCFCGFRIGFVFVDHVVFDSLCYTLWALFIVNSVCLMFELGGILRKRGGFKKKLFIVNTVLTALSIAASIAFVIIGKDDILNFIYVSRETLPYLAGFFAFLFFALIFPSIRVSAQRIIAGVTAAAICVTALAGLFPIGGFAFESSPAVFDTGSEYHIVFATNRNSLGYVKLEADGSEQLIWDSEAGRKDSSRIHSVKVPYEALNGKTYAVGAIRATEDIAYGGHLGKEITQSVGKFTPCREDDFNLTCVTDNHGSSPGWTVVGKDSDMIVFLGDIANGLYTTSSIIDNLLVPAGIMSEGSKPVIYALGNHDHRGNEVQYMLDALDFGKYYYRVGIGDYTFTVLDSGEDKEDENYEYAGYNDFSSYFDEETNWVKSLEKESGYNVLITHSSEIFFEPDDKPSPVCEDLRSLGIDFTICGHSHKTDFVSAEDSKTGIAYYICGVKDGNKDIKYTKMRFSKGVVDIVSRNTGGQELYSEQVRLVKS